MAEIRELSSVIQIDGDNYNVNAKTAEKVANSLSITYADGSTNTFDGSADRSISIPSKSSLELDNVTNDAQVKRSEMGIAGGVATLNDSGKVPAEQLPSYIDDVLEFDNIASFPNDKQEKGKIYVALDTNKTYRWSGSAYVEIGGGTGSGSAANNGTLTIKKNGSDVAVFTADSASDVTANITVPTKTSDLTNDSGFKKITVSQDAPSGGTTEDIWFKY